MAEFTAKVRVKRKLETVILLADTKEQAMKKASMRGRVMSIKKRSAVSTIFSKGMKSSERVIFLRRLAAMIRSKVGTGTAFRIIGDTFSGRISKVSRTFQTYVESGVDFTKALDTMPKDFPSTTTALIKAGMQGSDIYKALNDAATFEIEMQRIRRSSGLELIVATIYFGISLAIIIACTEFLGPYVLSMGFLDLADTTPLIAFTFAAADIIGKLMIAVASLLFALFFLRFIIKPLSPGFADRVTLKIPVYRDLVLSQNNYATFYGMGMLIRSGVQMEHALQLTAETAPKGEIRSDLERALAATRKGKPWAEAMRNLHPTDVAALSTSLDRYQAADSVDAIATLYKDTYAQRISQVAPAMQLLAALFMAAAGAIMFGMMILPIMQMGQGVL